MTLQFSKSKELITVGDKQIVAWTRVRNELNGRRPLPDHLPDVVYTEPVQHPYMPRRFPVGRWKVGKPVAHKPEESYLYPFFIPTDAWQIVEIWKLKANGQYDKPTGATYTDSGYGLHFSTSPTTLGCIRIEKIDDLLWLVSLIRNSTEDIWIEVED